MKGCEFTHPDGRACSAPPMKHATRCWHHNPAVAERRDDARRRGGVASMWKRHGPESNVWDLSTEEGRASERWRRFRTVY